VGHILARHFHSKGHQVTVLSRHPQSEPWQVIPWDGVTPGPWTRYLEFSDALINLAGRSVNCRYYPANRRSIFDSRVRSTELLNRVVSGLKNPPPVWLNASTATIYRHALDRPMDEATGELGGSEPGAPDTWNFSIQVAKAWEEAFFSTEIPGVRKIALRSAVTFSPDTGGIFDVLSGLVRKGLGGAQGAGNQYVSWIHEFDFARAIELLISDPSWSGIVNIAAPNPLQNRDFMRALREAWGTPFGVPAPGWLIEIGTFFMRTESELVLKSRQVVPRRLLNTGFEFQFSHWPAAARDLVERSS
jgi:hypothetical protein